MNHESTRKAIYLVAGVLPATLFAMISLLAVMVPPLIIWTAAAWVGVAGLIQAFARPPYDKIHGKTALMLICGIIAMVPVTTLLLLELPHPFEWREDYFTFLVLIGSVGTLSVAMHFLYYQACLLLAEWLSILI